MNRSLVEQATHPDVLKALAKNLGTRWKQHETSVDNKAGADGTLADRVRLNRERPFDRQPFPDPAVEGPIRTRLGEDGPRIELPKPVTGPFGLPVRTFSMPAHLFKPPPGAKKIDAAEAQPAPEFLLTVGPHVFEYDATGIRATPVP